MRDLVHLIDDPVFAADGHWRLRLRDGRSLPLRHATGTPVERFVDGWRPSFAYDGLGVCYLLGFESPDGGRATWFVGTDGKRLGDRLDELPAEQRALLGEVMVTRGLLDPEVRARDGLGLLDPALLQQLLALGRRPAASPPATAGEAMLRAPEMLPAGAMLRPGETQSLRLKTGWKAPRDGAAQACPTMSVLSGPALQPGRRHLLTLALQPCGAPVEIDLLADDRRVAVIRLDPAWQSEGVRLAYWLTAPDDDARVLRLAFRHDHGFVLAGLCLQPEPEDGFSCPEPRELMHRFENLGDNCEFGLVQRHFGAEPLGLLRFAGLRHPVRLIRMLEEDFAGLGQSGSLEAVAVGEEYWIRDQTYGIAYHTFRPVAETNARALVAENEDKLRYLIRKFREDLEDGEKILVYKRAVTQDAAEILALQAALNRFGGRNRLLWVTETEAGRRAGEVAWVGRRLLHGFTDRISLAAAGQFDAAVWLRLCQAAYAAFGAAA